MQFKNIFFVIAMILVSPVSFSVKSADAKNLKNDSQNVNVLQLYGSLNNRYITLRHGESVPSMEGRVCSTMESGTDSKNGLTEKGREEVIEHARAWITANRNLIASALKNGRLFIMTSPFSRTKETAEIFADALDKNFKKDKPKSLHGKPLRSTIIVEDDLRERNFGKFEGQLQSGEIYAKVWEEDRKNPNHTKWGVESANAVQKRVSQVIARLERQGQENAQDIGNLYILVSHGDTLKIAQTAFQRQSAAEHRNPDSVKPIKTAEFREMSLVPLENAAAAKAK